MKKHTWARLSREEVQRRILELESVYGQKKLAKLLGISRDSVRRYRDGSTFPQTKQIYNKINQAYNVNKPLVNPEKVERKKTEIKKKSESQKYGRVKNRYAPMYPNYLYKSPASDFQESRNWDKLEEMGEQGFVAAWRGRDIIPLEVQFMAEGAGEPLTRFGKVVNIVTAVSRITSPKDGTNFGEQSEIVTFPTYYRLIRGLKKTDSFDERIDKIRNFVFDELKVDRGYIVAFMGFYFEEGDEI